MTRPIGGSERPNVLFIALGDMKTASSRFRTYQWLSKLKDCDLECHVLPRFVRRGTRGRLSQLARNHLGFWITFFVAVARADVVLVQEVLLPVPVTRWLRRKRRYVFDMSDPVHLQRETSGALRGRLRDSRRGVRFRASVRSGARVLIENELLENDLRSMGAEPIIMRGPVDTESFRPRSRSRESVVVGWTGSQSTWPLLQPLLPIIDELGLWHPEMRLQLVGAPETPTLSNVEVKVEPWDLETEPGLVAEFDIGIFFLPNTPIAQARGGGKLFLYMAAGLAVVASSVGIGPQVIAHEETGLLAESPEQWKECLSRVIADRQLRRYLGQNARRVAEENYSYSAYVPEMLSILSAGQSGRAALELARV